MWIKGSTLSISQRTLLPARPLTPLQRAAQELATELIQSYGARHVMQKAIDFIGENSPIEVSHVEQHLVFTTPLSVALIPKGYGVKGGAARESLVAGLNLREPRQPRDIDLVRKGHHRSPQDDVVAKQHMGRDFELGARVELIRNFEDYLASRDLTINEVVAIDSSVYASLLCVLDTMGKVVRPARYRSGTLHRTPSLHGQSLLKMARLYAEGAYYGESWTITGIPEQVEFSEFDLAVHLNKAFQRGREVANEFLYTCEVLSLITATDIRVQNALEELEHLRHGERGMFPDVPSEEWIAIDKALSSL